MLVECLPGSVMQFCHNCCNPLSKRDRGPQGSDDFSKRLAGHLLPPYGEGAPLRLAVYDCCLGWIDCKPVTREAALKGRQQGLAGAARRGTTGMCRP